MKPFPHIEYDFTVERKGARPAQIKQVHTALVHEIRDEAHAYHMMETPPEGDASLTFASGLPLYVFTADCIPFLFFTEDPQGPIAAVHAGWRGAAAGIVSKTIERLGKWGDRLHVAIGPSILGCCFEIQSDLVDAFAERGRDISPFLHRRGARLTFSLASHLIATDLAGWPKSRLHVQALVCTVCSTPKLPSFRRNKDTDPRLWNWIKKV